MTGQTITEKIEMENQFRTDRTQANAKKWIDVIKQNLKSCRQYDLDFILRCNSYNYDLYQGHTTRKNEPCEKFYTFFASKSSLQEIAYLLQNYVCLFKDRHIIEHEPIRNKSKSTWVLVHSNNCFECGMDLDDPKHEIDNTPYQNCLSKEIE